MLQTIWSPGTKYHLPVKVSEMLMQTAGAGCYSNLVEFWVIPTHCVQRGWAGSWFAVCLIGSHYRLGVCNNEKNPGNRLDRSVSNCFGGSIIIWNVITFFGLTEWLKSCTLSASHFQKNTEPAIHRR